MREGPGLCSPERGGRRPSERGPAAVDVRKVSASDVTPTRLQVPTVVRGQCCSHHRRKDARTLEVQGGAGAELDYRVDGSMHVKRWRFLAILAHAPRGKKGTCRCPSRFTFQFKVLVVYILHTLIHSV